MRKIKKMLIWLTTVTVLLSVSIASASIDKNTNKPSKFSKTRPDIVKLVSGFAKHLQIRIREIKFGQNEEIELDRPSDDKIFIEGKATDVYEFEYFSSYPPFLRKILERLTGKHGRFLAFGYREYKHGIPVEIHSVGWIVINGTTNLSGVLWGTLGIIGDGKGRTYWIGVERFEGILVQVSRSEKYFRGFAEKVGIEAR